MDLENQNRVKQFVDDFGAENVVVMLGAAEGEGAGLAAETVMAGDPTFAGCLAGVPLGLLAVHAVEPEFKEIVNPEVFEEQVSMMEMVLDVESIMEEMQSIRSQHCKFL